MKTHSVALKRFGQVKKYMKRVNQMNTVFNQINEEKKDDNKEVSNLSTSSTPWSFFTELSIANERASSTVYTKLQEINPGPHFTKPWTLRTMNSKLQVRFQKSSPI